MATATKKRKAGTPPVPGGGTTTPPSPTVTPPQPVAGPTPSVTPVKATSPMPVKVALGQKLKGDKKQVSAKVSNTPKGLSQDQAKRKAGKSQYYWKDKSGKWHYHITGKTTTDETTSNPIGQGPNRKNKGEKFYKKAVTPKRVQAQVDTKPKPNAHGPKPASPASYTQTKPAPSTETKPQLRTGVSAKMYDTAKVSILNKRKGKRK